MKNTKKIEQINAKISELQKMQKQLEDKFIQDISNQVARILLKQKAFNIDRSTLLKVIENTLDEIQKGNKI